MADDDDFDFIRIKSELLTNLLENDLKPIKKNLNVDFESSIDPSILEAFLKKYEENGVDGSGSSLTSAELPAGDFKTDHDTVPDETTPDETTNPADRAFPVFSGTERKNHVPFDRPPAIDNMTRHEILQIAPDGEAKALRENEMSLVVEQLKAMGKPLQKRDLKLLRFGPLGQFLQRVTVRETPDGSTSAQGGISGAFGAAVSQGAIRIEYPAMRNFLLVREVLADQGIHLSANDYLRTHDSGKRFLVVAQQEGIFADIFSPYVWKGRVAEMQKLWDKVEHKGGYTDHDFEGWKRNTLILEKPEFEIPDSGVRDALFAKDSNGICALDDVRTWEKWKDIETAMEKSGEAPLSKEELFEVGFLKRPFIDIAFHACAFYDVQNTLRASENPVTVEELRNVGLKHIIKTVLAKFSSINSLEELETFAPDAIAFSKNDEWGQKNINTKICSLAMSGEDGIVTKLLAMGVDPYPEYMEKVTYSHADSVLLFKVAGYCDADTTQALLDVLEKKYDDPVRLLNALTCLYQGQTVLSFLEKQGREDNAKLVKEATSRVSEPFLEKDVNEMLMINIETQVATRDVFDMLLSAGHARDLFAAERWFGEARAMQLAYNLVPDGIKNNEFSGENGLPSFEDLLAQVNAATIKAMTLNEPKIQ